MGDDRRYMLRAIELAAKAAGSTSPNPMVGCLLVKDGAIVGEGWHKGPGSPHAEAEALAAAGEAARGATAYVTLEPCSHKGRTPPCVDALVKAGVVEVVYAMEDPNPLAAGGAAKLEARGICVRTGLLEREARYLNRFWLHTLESPRPYVVAKFAMSLDGKIATRTGESRWISSVEARERAHELRRFADAVVVGADTVVADDPSLTARIGPSTLGHPLRVVLDSTGRTPLSSAVFDRGGRGALLATTKRAPAARRDEYRGLGVDVLVLDTDDSGRPDVRELLVALKARGVCGVLVEGGAATLGSFFDAGVVDESWIFIAPIVIGGGTSAVQGTGAARLAEAFRLHGVDVERLGPDILVRGYAQENACSPAS